MPQESWLDTKPVFREGSFCYPAKTEVIEQVGFPNPREWSPADEDWKLPENWFEIIHKGFKSV